MREAGCALLLALCTAAGGGAAAKKLTSTVHLGVDFGAQSMKLSVEQTVKGHKKAVIVPTKDPVVVNLQGKRTTSSAVQFQAGGVLAYGEQALATQGRSPAASFVHLGQLLGQPELSSACGGRWFATHGLALPAAPRSKGGEDAARPQLQSDFVHGPGVEPELLAALLLKHGGDLARAQASCKEPLCRP
jgi:molecular chaperone DnaK (HSP70)